MPNYEFKVIPAPDRAQLPAGKPRSFDPFSDTVQTLLNELGSEGWDFVRAEHLPARRGIWLFGGREQERTLLVFRRVKSDVEARLNLLPSRIHAAPDEPKLTASPPQPQPEPKPQRQQRHEVPHFVRTARLADTPALKAVGDHSGG